MHSICTVLLMVLHSQGWGDLSCIICACIVVGMTVQRHTARQPQAPAGAGTLSFLLLIVTISSLLHLCVLTTVPTLFVVTLPCTTCGTRESDLQVADGIQWYHLE